PSLVVLPPYQNRPSDHSGRPTYSPYGAALVALGMARPAAEALIKRVEGVARGWHYDQDIAALPPPSDGAVAAPDNPRLHTPSRRRCASWASCPRTRAWPARHVCRGHRRDGA